MYDSFCADCFKVEATTVAKPMNELAVQNAKYAAECTELHLAKRGITMLWDRDSFGKNEFERFINLEVFKKSGYDP